MFPLWPPSLKLERAVWDHFAAVDVFPPQGGGGGRGGDRGNNMLLMLGVVSSMMMLHDAGLLLMRKIRGFFPGAGRFCLCIFVSPRTFP